MATSTVIPASSEHPAPAKAVELRDLYALLRRFVLNWVVSSHTAVWRGQEQDVAEDIVQEAIMRVYERQRQAERGDYPVIKSLEAMARRIAWCRFIDLMRRDLRLVRISEAAEHEEQMDEGDTGIRIMREQVSPDDVIEQEFKISLFRHVANSVAHFPPKLRRAILIDLANRADFDPDQPTLLQQAFAETGIQLQEYQGQLPSDRVIRSRHASLVSLAYKRIAQLPAMRTYQESL